MKIYVSLFHSLPELSPKLGDLGTKLREGMKETHIGLHNYYTVQSLERILY